MRPDDDELLRRMTAWADEWRAVAGCTEPADRPRAEAALAPSTRRPERRSRRSPGSVAHGRDAGLHVRVHGRAPGSRARGHAATSGTATTASSTVSPTRSGWSRRGRPSRRQPGGRIPPTPRQGRAASDPIGAAATALRMDGTDRTMALVRSVASRATVGRRSGDAVDRRPTVDDGCCRWRPRRSARPGRRSSRRSAPDLAGSLFAEAVGRVVTQVLVSPEPRRNAVQAMQPGQWDTVTPAPRRRPRRLRRLPVAAPRGSCRTRARRSTTAWSSPARPGRGGRSTASRSSPSARSSCGGTTVAVPTPRTGPAIAWADGLEAYAWRGVAVEPWIVTDPGRITVERHRREPNVEVRRVLVERFGEERLLREGGARARPRGRDRPALAPRASSASGPLASSRRAGRHGGGPELDTRA